MLEFHIISVLNADNSVWNVLFGTTPDRTQIYSAISRRYLFISILWHGNECGKNKSNENFKAAIPSNNYDRP